MGFYSRVIFPRLCELALSRPHVARHRRQLLAAVHGEVLEIGFGTGLNLPHYPQTVKRIVTVDPNVGMHSLARKRMKRSNILVESHTLSGEQLLFPTGTFDFVVSTFTLCSINEVERALSEAYRVLKPGGRLLFLEHGLSPDPVVQKWQRRLNGLEQLLADGCRLDRDMKALLAEVPFTLDVETFYLENTPRTHGYLYRGSATK